MSIGKPEKRKMLPALFLALLCGAAGVLSLGSMPALAACPNEALRTGPSASLPDCRAYETVSPADKNGHSVAGGETSRVSGQAAAAGGAVAYIASGPFPGSASGANLPAEYLAVREGGGWSDQSLFPPQAFSYGATVVSPAFPAFSAELSKAVLGDATDSPPLVVGEQETGGLAKTSNLFVRDNTTGTYSLVNFHASGLAPGPYRPTFDGASADFGTVIFNAPAALTPGAPGGSGGSVDNLYEWEADGSGACNEPTGCIGLVSQIPPSGDTSCGPAGPACVAAAAGGRFGSENAVKNESSHGSFVRVISSDGSRIFFTANGDLYVRENGETTVQVDATQGGAGPGGGGLWATAAGDGSRVFFYDDASAGLTSDTVPGSGTNLYSYDTGTETLTDLTPGPEAGVQGVVNEASQDGFYLYFVANGVLTSVPNSLEEAASPGDCQEGRQGNQACNLYLSHDGAISFVRRVSGLAAEFVYMRLSVLGVHTASRVTPDGLHIAFFAEGSGSPEGGHPTFAELLEYSAGSGQVSRLCGCAVSEFRGLSDTALGLEQEMSVFQYTRGLSDDGTRVFFESYQALPALNRPDTNGQPDVYEYELDGAGGCTVAPGCLYLISSGTSSQGSWFVDASASGEDVFFTTNQQLVSSDTDGAFDLYDARVDGGFPAPPKPPECLGDACLSVPPAPIDATPASFTFAGAGNLTSAQAAKPAAKSRAPKKRSRPKRKRLGKKAKAKRAGKTSRKGIK
jgi:hypothetical protein